MIQLCRSHCNIDLKYLGCFSHATLIGTQIRSHQWIRIWPWRTKHQQRQHSHHQEHIILSNDTPVTPSQRPTWHHSVERFFIHRVPIVVKHPKFKCTVHHNFFSNHIQTFCNFIYSPPCLQLTPSNHYWYSIISRRTPPHSIVRIERWQVFFVVLIYYIIKFIIHLTFMSFQILFHIFQHLTETVHRQRHWEGG